MLASTCASAGLLILSLATPPLIYKAPLNQTLREDSVALIRCEIAIGAPGSITPVSSLSASLQIQWLHNGSQLNTHSQRYLQLESGTLQIHGKLCFRVGAASLATLFPRQALARLSSDNLCNQPFVSYNWHCDRWKRSLRSAKFFGRDQRESVRRICCSLLNIHLIGRN